MLGIIAIPTFAPRFAVTIGSSRETRMNGTCMSSRRIAQCSSNCSTTVLVKRLDPQVLFLAIYAVQTNLTMLAENVYMPQDLSTLHPGVCETATKRCDSKEFAGTPLPRLRNVVASSRRRVVASSLWRMRPFFLFEQAQLPMSVQLASLDNVWAQRVQI